MNLLDGIHMKQKKGGTLRSVRQVKGLKNEVCQRLALKYTSATVACVLIYILQTSGKADTMQQRPLSRSDRSAGVRHRLVFL